MSDGDTSEHHHEVTWLRKVIFWSKTALKSGIRRLRIEITRNKLRDFHTKIWSYSVTSHATWENSIEVKKLIKEVDIQPLHDSCFCSDVKLSLKFKTWGVISYFKRIIKSIWDHWELETWSNDSHLCLFAIFFSEFREMTLNDLRNRKIFVWPWIQRGQ